MKDELPGLTFTRSMRTPEILTKVLQDAHGHESSSTLGHGWNPRRLCRIPLAGLARPYVPRRFSGHPRAIPRYVRTRNDSILRQWLSEKATPELILRIGKAKEELYRQLVREHGIAPIPGALEWVKLLYRQGWGQAIASAASRANVETILDVLHASESFEAIVSAEDVHRGKPDPEVLLIAATKLGAAPKHCIVVEDAEHGIEAARAAGMKSIGVSQNGKNLPADIVVRLWTFWTRTPSTICCRMALNQELSTLLLFVRSA